MVNSIFEDMNAIIAIHEYLSLNICKKIRIQTLTNDQIQRRKSFARLIKNRFEIKVSFNILFGEKWFDQDDT